MTDRVELVELAPQPVAVVKGRVETREIPGFFGAAYRIVRVLGEQHHLLRGIQGIRRSRSVRHSGRT
jgi:hypothetical protein